MTSHCRIPQHLWAGYNSCSVFKQEMSWAPNYTTGPVFSDARHGLKDRVEWIGDWICENTGPSYQSYSQRKVDDFERSEMRRISKQPLWEQIYRAQRGLRCFQWTTLLVALIVFSCHQPWHSSGHVFGILGTGMNSSYSERAYPEGKNDNSITPCRRMQTKRELVCLYYVRQ